MTYLPDKYINKNQSAKYFLEKNVYWELFQMLEYMTRKKSYEKKKACRDSTSLATTQIYHEKATLMTYLQDKYINKNLLQKHFSQ
ncbi:MAG: hypothetical protein ABFR62_05695 [Bacteroidota bacterium]